jgi:micrococcal nuclease
MFTYQATILRIVDGDTVDVDIDLGFSVWLKKQRVRMMGIDTPESRTRDKEEKVRGLLSKKKLAELCPVGSIVQLMTAKDKNKGKFGRILGTLVVNGVDVNQWLIENNYAVPYLGQSKDDIEKGHLTNRQILIERGEITGNIPG